MLKKRLLGLEQRSGYYCPRCQQLLQPADLDLRTLHQLDVLQLQRLQAAIQAVLVERGAAGPTDPLALAGISPEAWHAFVDDTLRQHCPDGGPDTTGADS